MSSMIEDGWSVTNKQTMAKPEEKEREREKKKKHIKIAVLLRKKKCKISLLCLGTKKKL